MSFYKIIIRAFFFLLVGAVCFLHLSSPAFAQAGCQLVSPSIPVPNRYNGSVTVGGSAITPGKYNFVIDLHGIHGDIKVDNQWLSTYESPPGSGQYVFAFMNPNGTVLFDGDVAEINVFKDGASGTYCRIENVWIQTASRGGHPCQIISQNPVAWGTPVNTVPVTVQSPDFIDGTNYWMDINRPGGAKNPAGYAVASGNKITLLSNETYGYVAESEVRVESPKGTSFCSATLFVLPKGQVPGGGTPGPGQIPNLPTGPVIDFTQLAQAIPGLRQEFQPGPASNVSGIISLILPYLFVIAGLILLIMLIYGGFHMMFAANDQKGLQEARGKITNALMGFLLLFISYWLVQIVEAIFGLSFF